MALTGHLRSGHTPLLITAHLRTGVGLDLPYGLDLAGILATRLRAVDRAELSARGTLRSSPLPDTTQEDPEDMDLPLSTCATDPGAWHWLASCALPQDPDEHPEPRTFYRTVDAAWAQRAASRPLAYHHPSKGPYRDVMMPSPVIVTPALQWRAYGDAPRVEHLLRGIRFLGRRRAVGEGRVLSWEVSSPGIAPEEVLGWVHHEGEVILRPCPTACAQALGLEHRIGWYAIRPPSWHTDRLAELAMTPENEEEW